MHKILKTFPYSPDGVRVVTLGEGSEHEIRADLVEGLTAAGYIAEASQMPQDEPEIAEAADVAEDQPEPAKRGPGRPRKG